MLAFIGNLGVAELLLLLLFGVMVIPYVFYLLTLQSTFEAVSLPNRELTPGLVWLNFIPIFNLGWAFVIVIKLANSIKKEYAALGIQGECTGGLGVGLAYAICAVLSIIPFVGIGALVCWILHWVQISNHRKKIIWHQLQHEPPGAPGPYPGRY